MDGDRHTHRDTVLSMDNVVGGTDVDFASRMSF